MGHGLEYNVEVALRGRSGRRPWSAAAPAPGSPGCAGTGRRSPRGGSPGGTTKDQGGLRDEWAVVVHGEGEAQDTSMGDALRKVNYK